ncbi:unnamed protein product, partial [Staurois parvus]
MRDDQRVNCGAVSVCFTLITLLWLCCAVHSHPKQCARADGGELLVNKTVLLPIGDPRKS